MHALPAQTKIARRSASRMTIFYAIMHFVFILLMSWPLGLDKALIMSKIHLLNSQAISNLKRKAKKLSTDKSLTIAQALHIVAVGVGFSCWKELLETSKYEYACKELNFILDTKHPDFTRYIERYHAGENSLFLLENEFKSIVLNEFTERQKIGAITRIFGLYPSKIKNIIHVYLADQDDAIFIAQETWELHGLLDDQRFIRWIGENDPYFYQADMGIGLFRLLALDTTDYNEVFQYISGLGKKLNLQWGLGATHIWINGKIDPDSLIPEDDDPRYINQIPLSEVPKVIWRLP